MSQLFKPSLTEEESRQILLSRFAHPIAKKVILANNAFLLDPSIPTYLAFEDAITEWRNRNANSSS